MSYYDAIAEDRREQAAAKSAAATAAAIAEQTTAELEKTQAGNVDIFYAQQQIVDSLNELLLKNQAGTAGTVYVQPQRVQRPANYMLYIGLAAGVFALWYFFLRK